MSLSDSPQGEIQSRTETVTQNSLQLFTLALTTAPTSVMLLCGPKMGRISRATSVSCVRDLVSFCVCLCACARVHSSYGISLTLVWCPFTEYFHSMLGNPWIEVTVTLSVSC